MSANDALALRLLDSTDAGFDAELGSLLAYSADADAAIEATVEAILADAPAEQVVVDLVRLKTSTPNRCDYRGMSW